MYYSAKYILHPVCRTSSPIFRIICLVIFLFSFYFFLIVCDQIVQASGQRNDLFQELHPGVRIYRYDWMEESCVLYVAEMDCSHPSLHFEVALAADEILRKESVRSIAHQRSQRGNRRVLIAINGGFGVLGDIRGYGGALENLHIQDGELMA